jgi:membrane fusion protein (multidrug efflux system)
MNDSQDGSQALMSAEEGVDLPRTHGCDDRLVGGCDRPPAPHSTRSAGHFLARNQRAYLGPSLVVGWWYCLRCLPIVLSLFLASCSKGAAGKPVEQGAAPASIQVHVATVEQKEVQRTVESVGSLFALEEVTVSSEVEGKVQKVLVDVGDRVSKGQPLVEVSPIELKLAFEQQKAALEQAKAKLGIPEGTEDIDDVREAAEVKKAAADLADADQKYRRATTLLAQGVLPRQSFEEAESKYKATKAAYDLSIQSVQNVRAQVSQYRASMELAQKKVADSVIRAPFSGEIKERSVVEGQYLKIQTPVTVIVEMDPLRVRLKVPEKMAGWIKTGQQVTIIVEAYPDRTFTGKLSRINPSVDQQTRSFDVEALIDNNQGLLKPGFFVKARIPSSKMDRALLVNADAVHYVYGVYKVYVVEGNTVKEKEVKIGERAGEGVEIMEGLGSGDRVALPVKGQELKDRASIEIVP